MPKKSGISGVRSVLYGLAKVLGDVSAVKKGTVGKRVTRSVAGKVAGKAFKKPFK